VGLHRDCVRLEEQHAADTLTKVPSAHRRHLISIRQESRDHRLLDRPFLQGHHPHNNLLVVIFKAMQPTRENAYKTGEIREFSGFVNLKSELR
jgi:hypothetical protein